jgi:hypothetical protein
MSDDSRGAVIVSFFKGIHQVLAAANHLVDLMGAGCGRMQNWRHTVRQSWCYSSAVINGPNIKQQFWPVHRVSTRSQLAVSPFSSTPQKEDNFNSKVLRP